MRGQKGRPPIRYGIKKHIIKAALKDRHADRQVLAVILRKEITEMGEDPPTESTIIKEISKARRAAKSPLDKPWGVVTMAEHNVTPEALLIVLKVWAREIKKGIDLSIREAMWISRLHAVFLQRTDLQEDVMLDSILEMAREYSRDEMAIEIMGRDPSDTQAAMMGVWVRDAGFYGRLTGDYEPVTRRRDQLINIRENMLKNKKGGTE